jgi:hypothetical protein
MYQGKKDAQAIISNDGDANFKSNFRAGIRHVHVWSSRENEANET